jgi:outer membrane protein OmpA-like peptidoglycan-associated protein
MSLDLEINDEVFANLGVAKQLGLVEVDGGFGFATAANDMFGSFNRNYAEAKIGGSYDFTGPLLAFAAMGAGLSEGYGTPDWRLLVGVRVDREKPEEKPAPMPPGPPVCTVDCPDMDNDKDGIKNEGDQCRNDPEDFDQFEDTDGCPETDNDKDSIFDTADKCPNDAEDMDSFEDSDGCPETDNDRDTVLDAQDKCPIQAGDPENAGCPWPDTDGDGVIDKLDNCPKWKGKAEHQGCNVKQLVKITESKLELYETMFFATNKAVIQKRSYKLLNNVAEVIRNHTDLKISIEGHTDSQGSDAWNMKLSQMRAQSVMAYLVKRGVDPTRLAAQGYGEERPIADNKTAKGRAQNRRVEFMASRIIETTTTTVVPAPDPTTATPAAPKK